MYQSSQCNSFNQVSSYLPENNSKNTDLKVIYRTQEYINTLEDIRYAVLQNRKTLRKSSASVLLKIISSRNEKFGNCITRQTVLADEMIKFGYHKRITEKQISRIANKLRDSGLITFIRTIKKNGYKATYSYKLTELGREIYFYVIKNNESNLQIKVLESTTKSVDNCSPLNKLSEYLSKMSGPKPVQSLYKSMVENKNVRSNINIPYLNLHTHTRWTQNKNSEVKVIEEEKKYSFIDLKAEPIDIDEPPFEFLQKNNYPYLESFQEEIKSGNIKICSFSDPDHLTVKDMIRIKHEEPPVKMSSIPINKTKLSHEVYQFLWKNFNGIQFNIVCEILENTRASGAVKMNIIESLKQLVANLTKRNKPIRNFYGLAYSITNKVLYGE